MIKTSSGPPLEKHDFDRVAMAAADQIESLLKTWLPNGVKENLEYCVGSRHGEAGKSMRIHLGEHKKGYWSDFAADDSGTDLISLYAYIYGISQGKACREMASQLGITVGSTGFSAPAPARTGVEAPTKKESRSDWEPIVPVPANAPPYPKAHIRRGHPEMTWEYYDIEGKLQGVIYRFKTSDGKKEVLPCVYTRHRKTGAHEWRWMVFPEPRPLYLPGGLHLDKKIVIVEGEKCALAGHKLNLDYCFISWPGGSKAVDKADWSPLFGASVLLWADADAQVYNEKHPKAGKIRPEADQPGMKAMLRIAAILREQDCDVQFVDIPTPGEMPDGWDIDDLIASGASAADVNSWLDKLREADHADEDIPSWVTDPSSEGGSAPCQAVARKSWPDWKRDLRKRMITTSSGGVKSCRENVYMVMQDDPALKGIVGLDLFSNIQIKLRQLPWKTDPGEWTEGDDFQLGMYLSFEHGLTIAALPDIERAVMQIARENAFNPVLDYFRACRKNWDGFERVEEAFVKYWGAKPSIYMYLVSRMFFIGMAKRVFDQGCKHDHAPVFEGGQGEGKSTMLSILGGEWFADTPFKMGDKDSYLAIQGVLLYEIAELEQFNRSETTAIKAFMSSIVDRFREPYGRRIKNVPRRAVFAATTNEGEYFKDTTGNRRFWPVETGRLDLDGLRRDRDQLIGEAVHLMEQGVLWYPTREEQRLIINAEQEKREIPDPWLGRIYNYLEGENPDGTPLVDGSKKQVKVLELLTKALNIEIGRIGPARSETMRIAACMRKLGWTIKRESKGAREKYYVRPEYGPEQGSEGEYVPE